MEKKTTAVVKSSDRFYELMKACNDIEQPNPKARAELQGLVKNNPDCQAIMQQQHNLYTVALTTRIESFKSSDTFKEVMLVKCDQLREELGYALANSLERLAIEQIVICWLNYHQTELYHAEVLAQSPSRETGIYWEKRLAFASRRYNRALETLSKMRKMNLVVQVNNAQNQIVQNG